MPTEDGGTKANPAAIEQRLQGITLARLLSPRGDWREAQLRYRAARRR